MHQKHFKKWLVGGCIYLSSDPPGFAPGRKLRKPSKSLAHFSHLNVFLILLLFTKRLSEKGGHDTIAPPKYSPDYHQHCGIVSGLSLTFKFKCYN